MFKLSLAAITALAIRVASGYSSLRVQLTFVSSATAEIGDLNASDTVAGSIIVYAQDGSATTFASGLTNPQGIALDSSADVYVCESDSGDLLKPTPTPSPFPSPSRIRLLIIIPPR